LNKLFPEPATFEAVENQMRMPTIPPFYKAFCKRTKTQAQGPWPYPMHTASSDPSDFKDFVPAGLYICFCFLALHFFDFPVHLIDFPIDFLDVPIDFLDFSMGFLKSPLDHLEFPMDFITFPMDFIDFPVDFLALPMDFIAFPIDFREFPMIFFIFQWISLISYDFAYPYIVSVAYQ